MTNKEPIKFIERVYSGKWPNRKDVGTIKTAS
jgi:hypothetical protein